MKIGGQIPVIVRGAGLWGKGCNLKRGGGGTSYHQDVVGVSEYRTNMQGTELYLID